jgi:3-hydroxyisobutyrate dehydrogenase
VRALNIGVIGLGIMGSNLARCLHSRGVRVGVYNRTVEKAEKLAHELQELRVYESPTRLVRESDAVVVFVSDDDALMSVVSSIVSEDYTSTSPVLVNASTVTPMASLRAMSAIQEAGVVYSEGPVYGSADEARECKLVSYIACRGEIYERIKIVAELYSARVLYVGEPPRASVLKLALNNIGLSAPALLAESLALLRSWGVEEKLLLEASEGLWFKPMIERIWHRVFSEKSARFTVKLAAKDYLYIEKSLIERGVKPRVSPAIRSFYEEASRSGLGEKDYPRAAYYFIESSLRSIE